MPRRSATGGEHQNPDSPTSAPCADAARAAHPHRRHVRSKASLTPFSEISPPVPGQNVAMRGLTPETDSGLAAERSDLRC